MLTLLSFPEFLVKNKDVEEDVKATTDWILSTQTSKGNFPSVTEEVAILRSDQDHELVHWCHGAPGEFGTEKITILERSSKVLTQEKFRFRFLEVEQSWKISY